MTKDIFTRARGVMPGGVNSPVRDFGSVGGTPVVIDHAKGPWITTTKGTKLLDFCGSWGPLILGHGHPRTIKAVQAAVSRGLSFGTNTPEEVELAEVLCEQIPYVEQVRLVNSGTEAVMTALRLARGITGRNKILKFDGCYHGHSDSVLVSAGSGLLTHGLASSAGTPSGTAESVLVAPYNDLAAAENICKAHGDDLAAILVEPVAGNMGLVPPVPGYLAGLRRAADQCGALLIFDEVITGFRLGSTTYGAICNVPPDLTCLGKIIGGGMPTGAVAGPRNIMRLLAPEGPVYQAGTLSGNPVTVAAGLATLRTLIEQNPYPQLEARTAKLSAGVNALTAEHGVQAHCRQLGSMFTVFFTDRKVTSLQDVKTCNAEQFRKYYHTMLQQGTYLSPSQYEVNFVSTAHSPPHIDIFLKAFEHACRVCTADFQNVE